MASHHLAQFSAHSSSAKVDITYSICHVTSSDHMTKGLCDFTDGSSQQYITNLAGLVTIGIAIWEIKQFWFVSRPLMAKCLKSHLKLWDEAPHGESPPYQVWWPLALWQGRYDVFDLSHDFAKSRESRPIIQEPFYKQVPLKLSHHSAKFSTNSHCNSDIHYLALVCHVISQNYVIITSCDSMARSCLM